ncbi:hypothetical protein [Kutzneria sp. 744]|uniref:hypothetical protein n=1 Tax=Kutzneria sp. (strain 744) TaxID=345341 RepID=UPI0012FB9407|nr:hypothetical protein [Kutzneria sp. 744]
MDVVGVVADGVVVALVVVVTTGGVVVVTAGGVVVTTGGVVPVVGGGVVVVVGVTVTVKRVRPVSLAQVALMAYVPGLASAGAVATTLPVVPGFPLANGVPAQVNVMTRHEVKPLQLMVNWLPAGPLVGVTDTNGAVAASAVDGAAMPTLSASAVTVRTSSRIVPIHCGSFGPRDAARR